MHTFFRGQNVAPLLPTFKIPNSGGRGFSGSPSYLNNVHISIFPSFEDVHLFPVFQNKSAMAA